MSAVDEALKVLETPEFQGGLSDSEKILAACDILRAAPVAAPVAAPALAEPTAAPQPVEQPAAPVADQPQTPAQ